MNKYYFGKKLVRKSRKRIGNKIHLTNGKVLKIRKNKDGSEYYISGKSRKKTYVGKTGKPVKRRRSTKSFGRRRRRSTKSFGRRRRRSTKSFGRRRRRSNKRSFGRMPGLVGIMGNYSPSEMNTFNAYTGMSKTQMANHMENIPLSDRANFYTSV